MISPKLTYRIQRGKPSDCIKIRNTHRSSILNVCSKDYSKQQLSVWTAKRKVEGYRKAMKNGEVFYVAVYNKKIIGFSALMGNEVRAVYIHPKYIQKGVGRNLLKKIEQYAQRIKLKKINLYSTLTAYDFYKNNGYKTLKRRTYVKMRGVKIPCIKMSKVLK